MLIRSTFLRHAAPTILSIAGFGAVATPAIAQSTPVTSDQVETVIVTAERRAESAQTTSLAVTALSGKEITSKNVKDMTDLQFVSPSLSTTEVSFTENVNIRGIGLNIQSPTVVSGVALYRDGLFYPGNILADEPYYDIADVEVLRGPQGTFVGQNSTGGALMITSQNPNFDGFGGYIEGQGGNYTDIGIRGAVNMPISDTLSARVAFNHENRDSFFKNIGSNLVHPGNMDMSNIRVGLSWQPTDAFSALWKTEYNVNNTDGYAQQPVPGSSYAILQPSKPYVLDYDRTDTADNELSFRTGLELKYNFANGVALRSLSGFQYGQVNMIFDEDATSAPNLSRPGLPGLYQTQLIRERITTEEINLISPDTGFFRWVVGGTYVHRSVPVFIQSNVQPVGGTLYSSTIANIGNPADSYGFFGQGTFEVAKGLELQVGLRYSGDWIGSRGDIIIPPAGNLTLPNTQSYSDNKLTGKVALNWTVDQNNYIYAFVAKGYKSGGPNIASSDVFAPETVWDYELGWKSDWLDDHITVQANGFWMRYVNFQTPIFDVYTTSQNIINFSGASHIYGAELQAQGRFGNFHFDASGAYVHSRLPSVGAIVDARLIPAGTVELPQCAPAQSTGCTDYRPYYVNISNSINPYAPEYTASIGVSYDFNIGEGTLTPRLDYSYTSAQYTTIFNDPGDKLSDRRLLNGQLTYDYDHWQVTLYGTNLTDQVIVVGQQATMGGLANNEFLGAPRQYGLRVSKQF